MMSCDKAGYKTRQLAINAVKEIARRDKQSMKVYHCVDCNEYHISTEGKTKFIKNIRHKLNDVKYSPDNPFGAKMKRKQPQQLATEKLISKDLANHLKRLIEGQNQLNKQRNK